MHSAARQSCRVGLAVRSIAGTTLAVIRDMPHATRFIGWVLAIPLGALAAFGVSDVATPAQPPGSLVCYEAATEETFLSEFRAQELCQGSDTVGPVICYGAAQERTPLAEHEAIELCQCARSDRPVECYERATDETDLLDAQIMAMCNAQVLNNVILPNCISVDERA